MKKLLILISVFVLSLLISVRALSSTPFLNLYYKLGLIKDTIEISGTGSMYPTFPKGTSKDLKELGKEIVANVQMKTYPAGITLLNHDLFSYTLQHGDLVSFENAKTKDSTLSQYGEAYGYIKRVIGVPGDTVELRNGIVYLNKEPLKEPYTAQPHSTFGGDFLSECKVLTIPDTKYFVLGDNRKASADSRSDLGLIDASDVSDVLPFADQKGTLDKNYRDTSLDLSDSTIIKLDTKQLLELINEKRVSVGVKPLVLVNKLNLSATKRADTIIKYDDFSFEGTKSKGFDMKAAMNAVGYFNPVWGEIPVQGYFSANELIENLFAFTSSADFILDKEFTDIGFSAVEGSINACPTQVIVIHLAGYVPPNYSSEVIASWNKALSNMVDIQQSWQSLKNYKSFYSAHKKDVDRINYLISYRISYLKDIVQKMKTNVWLSDDQQTLLKKDDALSSELEGLITKVNGYVK